MWKNGYFEAVVINKNIEENTTKKTTGYFWWKKTEIIKETKYVLKCKINGSKYIFFNISVNKETYDLAAPDAKLAINLKFEYNYPCFYFLPHKSENITINV